MLDKAFSLIEGQPTRGNRVNSLHAASYLSSFVLGSAPYRFRKIAGFSAKAK